MTAQFQTHCELFLWLFPPPPNTHTLATEYPQIKGLAYHDKSSFSTGSCPLSSIMLVNSRVKTTKQTVINAFTVPRDINFIRWYIVGKNARLRPLAHIVSDYQMNIKWILYLKGCWWEQIFRHHLLNFTVKKNGIDFRTHTHTHTSLTRLLTGMKQFTNMELWGGKESGFVRKYENQISTPPKDNKLEVSAKKLDTPAIVTHLVGLCLW